MCGSCTDNLTVAGMKCSKCGMYMKAYLIPDNYSILFSNTKPEAVKFVGNFECTQCGHKWSITRTTPQ